MTEAELEEIRALGHLGMKPGACSGGEECRFRGAIDDLLSEVERLREWCYPDAPCRGCELPVLRAEVERLRAALAAPVARAALEEGE